MSGGKAHVKSTAAATAGDRTMITSLNMIMPNMPRRWTVWRNLERVGVYKIRNLKGRWKEGKASWKEEEQLAYSEKAGADGNMKVDRVNEERECRCSQCIRLRNLVDTVAKEAVSRSPTGRGDRPT
jgi:hypothetical protein